LKLINYIWRKTPDEKM